MKKAIVVCLILLLAGTLYGCQSKEKQVSSAVEAYLQALVTKDEATFTKLSCPKWQADAMLEYDAFGNVATTLKEVTCKTTSITSDSATVKCNGSIEASYQNEVQSFQLSERNFQLVNSGGDWLVCGY